MATTPEQVWREVECDPKAEYIKTLVGLKVPEFPFRWNPRDGIFARARDLPPSVDVAGLCEALIDVEPLKDVEYPINTLHWKIMIRITACYERVISEYWLTARFHMKSLLPLLEELKRSGEPDCRKYHNAFSYIAYALLTIDDEELEVEQQDQTSVTVNIVPPTPLAEVGESSRPATEAEAAQKGDEPVPSCSSTLDAKKKKPRRPPPRRQDLPTEPDEGRIPEETLMLIYQYAALFFKRYGLRGIERADQYLSTVIRRIEPRKSWWYFERAKLMQRKRESVPDEISPKPTELEFRLMEAAINIRKHPFYELHFGKLLGQMGTWDFLEAALEVYTEFEEHFSHPDLLCKCVEGILDLIRARDRGPQLDMVRDFSGKKAMYNNMLEAALHVLRVASDHPNRNMDLVRRCLGHYYLVLNRKDSKTNAIKFLRQCCIYTYDTALELIRLEEGDQKDELDYMFRVSQTYQIVKAYVAREIITHAFCSLFDLKNAVRMAVTTLKDEERMADVKTLHIPRIVYLRTRHGINWADVLEWQIRPFRLQFKEPYMTFLAMLHGQRHSIYGDVGPEVDFETPYDYFSSESISVRRDNDHPDVTGSSYFSRKVGELPVLYVPGQALAARSSPVNVLSKGYEKVADRMMNLFHADRDEVLERIEKVVVAKNPRLPGSHCEDETQSESSSERRERPKAISLRPPPKYFIGATAVTRWKEGSALRDDNSISSYKSSDDEALSGRTSRESRRTPSPLPGTSRRSPLTPSVPTPQLMSPPGDDMPSREDLPERLIMNIPQVKIRKPSGELDTDESSSDPSSQGKRELTGLGVRKQSTDSDTSSAFSLGKAISTGETPDEEISSVQPFSKSVTDEELRTAIASEMKRLLQKKLRQIPQGEVATPPHEDIVASPLLEQAGTSDLSQAPEGSMRHPAGGTAKALGKLSIRSKPLHTTPVDEGDIETSSGEGTGSERQTPPTDPKPSPEEMELEGDDDGASTG